LKAGGEYQVSWINEINLAYNIFPNSFFSVFETSEAQNEYFHVLC